MNEYSKITLHSSARLQGISKRCDLDALTIILFYFYHHHHHHHPTTTSSVTGQTKNVLAKIDNLLQQAGTSKQRLLTAQIWLKDIQQDFAPMNAVWSEWLDKENKPVRATTQAPMARPSILVEIQVTAAEEK